MIDSPANPAPAVRPDSSVSSRGSPPLSRAPEIAPVARSYHVREVVDQVITPNDFPRLASLVRALAPYAGTAREFGDGLQWEHNSDFSSLFLTINPEAPGTVIRADLRTDKGRVIYGLGTTGIVFLTAIGTAAAGFSLVGILSSGATALLVCAWGARQLARRTSRRQAAALRQLVEKIAAGIRGDLD